jgi:riboflavin transporter 2
MILVMNFSAWVDLLGVAVEIPLMVPLTPEGWTLPSAIALCMCAANIAPVLLVVLRWRQKKLFSEIPYIYVIIIVGIVSCCLMAIFWQQTTFLFGRDRSVWLLSTVFTLAILDCTSSLVFFDYMKRFRARYLTAAFVGEGLTGVIPTLFALAQGIGSEAICVPDSNGTTLTPVYTQPRFSVTTFFFLVTGIIVLSLIAFILLRWTNIVSLADAAEPVNIVFIFICAVLS